MNKRIKKKAVIPAKAGIQVLNNSFKRRLKAWIPAFAGMTLLLVIPVMAGQISQSLGGVTLTEVAPRIVTPNGDLLNDVIFFKFDNTLSGLPIESEILDINGAKVSNLSVNSTETSLMWDGKDEGGRTVPSGIYIYSIKLGSKLATGTVVVAR